MNIQVHSPLSHGHTSVHSSCQVLSPDPEDTVSLYHHHSLYYHQILDQDAARPEELERCASYNQLLD